MGTDKDLPGITLTPQQLKSRRQRNVAIGLAVGFFVLLFYVVTIAKLGPGVTRSPM
ncbi:MAG: hypothetical protein ACLP8A_02055 [Methylovirgula sp.]